jgi:hypothetical protein
MAIRQRIFAAALLCGGAGFGASGLAATINHSAIHPANATHAASLRHAVKPGFARPFSSRSMQNIELTERHRTSELNRQSLVGVGPQAQNTNPDDAASGV